MSAKTQRARVGVQYNKFWFLFVPLSLSVVVFNCALIDLWEQGTLVGTFISR